jgi:hypothetical protein
VIQVIRETRLCIKNMDINYILLFAYLMINLNSIIINEILWENVNMYEGICFKS